MIMTITTTQTTSTVKHINLTVPQDILHTSIMEMVEMDTDWEELSDDPLAKQIEVIFQTSINKMGETLDITGMIDSTCLPTTDLQLNVEMSNGDIEKFQVFKDYSS